MRNSLDSRTVSEAAVPGRGTFRLGIYDCCDETIPVQFVGRTYDESEFDRDVMALAIDEYSHLVACREGCTYAMAVFRDSCPPTKTPSRMRSRRK